MKLSIYLLYSKLAYFVDSLTLKYLCNRRSDSYGVSGIRFRTQKLTTLDSITNGENPERLGCIVLGKSALKSVYRISEFTVMGILHL